MYCVLLIILITKNRGDVTPVSQKIYPLQMYRVTEATLLITTTSLPRRDLYFYEGAERLIIEFIATTSDHMKWGSLRFLSAEDILPAPGM